MTKRFGVLFFALVFLLAGSCGCNQAFVESKGTTVPPSSTESPLPTEAPTDEKEPEEVLDGYFEIHFIDVGYGDAALVICDDKTMLVDAGGSGKLISSYLAEQNITYLDYVVSTHPHSDHAGGLAGALDAVGFGVALSPVAQYEDKSFQRFTEKVAEKGKTLTVPTVGDCFFLGDATVTVLGPLHTNYEDPNDLSLVLRIVYGETSFLFTGDMEILSENDLMASGANLQA
ncbi:MAG: MBL fold metallo-hydrolase, partial [Clostridia bacterium]|nr:MBL fold metallo-hydrolase [Clostridia bacterium]